MITKRELILFLIPCILLALPLYTWWNSPKLKPNNVYTPQSGPAPQFVTYSLGGFNLLQAKSKRKYDLKTKYHLMAHHGPDNSDNILILELAADSDAPPLDNEELKEEKKKYKGVQISLVTEQGVRIGDSPSQVRHKIGEPTLRTFDINLIYKYEYRGQRIYQAWYTFHKSKLRSIEFRDAAPPGKLNGFITNGGCP